MGRGGLGGGLVTTGLDRDHRLDARRGAGRRHELARIGDRFEIHRDGACLGIARQHVEPVGDVDIRHVAQRHDVAEAEIVLRRPVDQRRGDCAGLRQERDPALARGHMGEPGIEPDRRDHQSERVGADDAEHMRLGRVEHLLAQAVSLRQAGGDDHRGLPALLAQLRNDVGHRCRRRHDDRQVRRRGQVGRARVAFQSRNLAVFRIDRPDLALETGRDDVVHHHPAHRALANRRADHGQRTRSDHIFEISDRHGSSCLRSGRRLHAYRMHANRPALSGAGASPSGAA